MSNSLLFRLGSAVPSVIPDFYSTSNLKLGKFLFHFLGKHFAVETLTNLVFFFFSPILKKTLFTSALKNRQSLRRKNSQEFVLRGSFCPHPLNPNGSSRCSRAKRVKKIPPPQQNQIQLARLAELQLIGYSWASIYAIAEQINYGIR